MLTFLIGIGISAFTAATVAATIILIEERGKN